jgi:protein-disulfide isomerase
MSREPFTLTVAPQASDHMLGDPHAPITVVEYGDLECPDCRRAVPGVNILLKRYENQVRFIYRHFPLEEVHPHAELAAEAAECAGGQGKFWQMLDLLFENQKHLELGHLRGYAERLALDLARFDAEMEDHVHLQRIREHQQSGRESGVRSTPGFFVNGKIQDVSFGMHLLFEAVEAALLHKGTRNP